MSCRRAWLEEPCPQCGAAVGARCCAWRLSPRRRTERSTPLRSLHIARGWRGRGCPTCKAPPGVGCTSPSGRTASRIHAARLGRARHELLGRDDVWAELERRGASLAVVPFWGRAGRGGHTATIRLSQIDEGQLVGVERWTSRDELMYALEAAVWDRYGSFQGQPGIRGDVIWTLEDRRVVIASTRGDARFEEVVR